MRQLSSVDTTDKQNEKTAAKRPRLLIPHGCDRHHGVLSISAGQCGHDLSFAVLLLFIALGIVFDMIGVASTSATEKEFHSMAAHRVRGAREAVWMVRNAEKVSSICNDVVGDICGIISGATGALIVAHITSGGECGTQGCGIAADYRSDFGYDHRRQGSRQRGVAIMFSSRCWRSADACCPFCRSSWITESKDINTDKLPFQRWGY